MLIYANVFTGEARHGSDRSDIKHDYLMLIYANVFTGEARHGSNRSAQYVRI